MSASLVSHVFPVRIFQNDAQTHLTIHPLRCHYLQGTLQGSAAKSCKKNPASLLPRWNVEKKKTYHPPEFSEFREFSEFSVFTLLHRLKRTAGKRRWAICRLSTKDFGHEAKIKTADCSCLIKVTVLMHARNSGAKVEWASCEFTEGQARHDRFANRKELHYYFQVLVVADLPPRPPPSDPESRASEETLGECCREETEGEITGG